MSVYSARTGRLWVHNETPRRQAYQEHVYVASWSVCGTLTCSHPVKLWDLGRSLTVRETMRVQGFPDTFVPPRARAQRLLGNAVAVPCAAHACAKGAPSLGILATRT